MEAEGASYSSVSDRRVTRGWSALSQSCMDAVKIDKLRSHGVLPDSAPHGIPVQWPQHLASLSASVSTRVPSSNRGCLSRMPLPSPGDKAAASGPRACIGNSGVVLSGRDDKAQPHCRLSGTMPVPPQTPCCKSIGAFSTCFRRPSPPAGLFSVHSLVLLLSCFLLSKSPTFSIFSFPANAQVVSYNTFQAPAPFSAVPQRGAFFLYESGTHFYFPFFTSSAGTASGNTPRYSTVITFKNLRFTEDSSAVVESTIPSTPPGAGLPAANQGSPFDGQPVSPAGVEISLLPYEYTRTIFSAPTMALFCCTAPSPPQSFTPTAQCPYPGALRREVHASPTSAASSSTAGNADTAAEHVSANEEAERKSGTFGSTQSGGGGGSGTSDQPEFTNAGAVSPSSSAAAGSSSSSGITLVASPHYSQPVQLRRKDPGSDPLEVTLEVKEGGIYFLVISNCGGLAQLTFDGEILVRNAYGFLPGHEYPKMPFYFSFMLIYLGVCFFWGFLLYRQRANLIPFHKCMLLVAALGFLECMALFVYFSDFNMRGSRNSVLLVLSVLVAVVKNIFSYMLVLLGALGWSITIPVLDRKTVVKMQIIVVLYIILDTARQVSDEFSHSHSLPLILLLTCLFPISALNGLLFYWIISSINSNVEMLQQQKQHEKLLMYKRLYAVLLLAIFLAIIDLLCQIYVASWDSSFPWKNQWWLSDAVPHMLFLLVLAAMMFIWRPNHQSKRLAYFTELGDADDLERAAGDQRSKNFSEEELEAGIPNFQLHSVGSMSDEGDLSDGEQIHVTEMGVPDLKKAESIEEGKEHRSTSSSRAPTSASLSGSALSPQQQRKNAAPLPAVSPARQGEEGDRAGRGSGRRAVGRDGAGADEEGAAGSSARRGADPLPDGSVELASTSTAHASGSTNKAAADYK